VLYIVYWGAAEPLGQALVLPTIDRLASRGADITLVTFEKPADLDRADEMRAIRASLDGAGVLWIPLRYHKRPKVPAKVFDVLHGSLRGVLSRRAGAFDIVHARTFVGGPMGLLAARLLGARLIYHNEGFYPDEQVDGGVWRQGSLPHRIAKALEMRLYAEADAIITLSDRARAIVEGLPAVRAKAAPVVVVPSAVDLERFHPAAGPVPRDAGELRLIHIGSVGGRYMLDAVGRFVAVASRQVKRTHLRVLTPAAPALVEEMLTRGGLANGYWSSARVPYDDVPAELRRQHAGLSFLTQGISEHGCSPTKVGEYWACGLPVVTTPNVSDHDAIIRRERVGVILEGHSEAAYEKAASDLRRLLREPDLPQRCRRAAEAHYALGPACERQLDLYQRLAERGVRKPSARRASL
jgi:glycosyltransferase involved in cell wall biosynthesis